ncbi:Flowering time control protein FCA, partial [Ananas comosus]
MQMPGARHGFSGRGGSPDHNDGSHFVKLFIGSVPRTATEEEIRPLFEEHGDVIEVALIKDKKTGQQQGQLRDDRSYKFLISHGMALPFAE